MEPHTVNVGITYIYCLFQAFARVLYYILFEFLTEQRAFRVTFKWPSGLRSRKTCGISNTQVG